MALVSSRSIMRDHSALGPIIDANKVSIEPATRLEVFRSCHDQRTPKAGMFLFSGFSHQGLSNVLVGSSGSVNIDICLSPGVSLRLTSSWEVTPRLPKASPSLSEWPINLNVLLRLVTIFPYICMSRPALRRACSIATLSRIAALAPAVASSPRAWLRGMVVALYAEPRSILAGVPTDHSNDEMNIWPTISWFSRLTSTRLTMLLNLARWPGLSRPSTESLDNVSVRPTTSGVRFPSSMSALISGSSLPKSVLAGSAISFSMSVAMDSLDRGISGSTAALLPTIRLAVLTS